MFLIDHVLCSSTLQYFMSDIKVKKDFRCSIHRTLSIRLSCYVNNIMNENNDTVNGVDNLSYSTFTIRPIVDCVKKIPVVINLIWMISY